MLPLLSLLTLAIVIATLLPASRHSHWLVRGLDFPRLQIAIVAATLLAAQVLFLNTATSSSWGLMAASALCLIWQLWWVLPYTILWSKEVNAASNGDTARHLSILTANVLQTNRNSAALIDLVKTCEPDVLVTLESDQWWESQLNTLEQAMPYSVKCPLDNLYGMHVYSRLPLGEQEICYLVENDVPSIHATLELRSGDKVQVHFVHPAPPSPTENTESTERDAELITVARSIARTPVPVIVTGDLNDVAWSATTRLFRKISGLLDPRVGRGMFNTFNADYFFLRWPLDHLFHSAHFTLQNIQRLPPIGSDHFPLFTTLVFTPADGKDQSAPTPDTEDKARAQQLSDTMDVRTTDVPQPLGRNPNPAMPQ